MKRTIFVAVCLLAHPASASLITVVVQSPAGDALPASRVNLIALSDDAEQCRVIEQAEADEAGEASLSPTSPGLYMVTVELAGFLGAEVGPFRVEGVADADSEAPARLTVLLHEACDICVEQPASNSYLLTKRCAHDRARLEVP